jgi:hypothetical protein
MTETPGDQSRGLRSRIKAATKNNPVRGGIQAFSGIFLLLCILSTPTIWDALSLPSAAISPVYAFVSFSVVLQPNVGTALNWVIQRFTAAAIAGALGLCTVYITYAANGLSYVSSVTKGAVMTTLVGTLGFCFLMCGYRWPKFFFGFTVANIALPMVALSGFHLTYVEPLTMPYFLMNVCIGVGMAAFVSMFVLPITAGSTIRTITSTSMRKLGQGTAELMDILLKNDDGTFQKQQQASGSGNSNGGGDNGSASVDLSGFIESWTIPVSAAMVKARTLLTPVATEVDVYHRPVLFPRYAYACLLDLLRYYMSTLMTLVCLAEGEAPLGAVKSLKNEILPVAKEIEACFSTAAAVLESSGRGGGVLDSDENEAAVLYVAGLDKLTAVEDALHVLSTKHIDMSPSLASSNNIGTNNNITTATNNISTTINTSSYTEGEIVMADTVIAILFALGSRLRRLYFVLPETLSHRDSRVWDAWRSHYHGQTWDFEEESRNREESLTREEIGREVSIGLPAALNTTPLTTPNISVTGAASLNSVGLPSVADKSFSPFSSAALQRQVSEVKSPLLSHHLETLSSLRTASTLLPENRAFFEAIAAAAATEKVVSSSGGGGNNDGKDEKGLSSFFSTLKHRWNALPSLVDVHLPFGFEGEGLVLSLQLGIAFAIATVIHVCTASYDALHKNTIWIAITIAVLSQKSVGGIMLKGGNRVLGTVAAGLLGIGMIYFVYLVNGLTYLNNPPKFIFMTLCLSILSGILMWGSMQAPIHFYYSWMVCKLTLPIIVLIGYSGEVLLPKTALWRLLNVFIGLTIDLVVTSLVFPQSTKGAVERRVCKVLDDLIEISDSTSSNLLRANTDAMSVNMNRQSSLFKWQQPSTTIFTPSQRVVEKTEVELAAAAVVTGGAAGGRDDAISSPAATAAEAEAVLPVQNLHIRTTPIPTPFAQQQPPPQSQPQQPPQPLSSSPSFFVASPTKHRSKKKFRKERIHWVKHVALGKPVLQFRPIGQDAAALLVEISELEVIASFEEKINFSEKSLIFKWFASFTRRRSEKLSKLKITAIRRALRRMLNALLAFVYVLDGPDVPHVKLLLQHRSRIDALMLQISKCLLALRELASHNKQNTTKPSFDQLITTQTKLREDMKELLVLVESVPPPSGCTQADVVLGFAGLGVLIAAVQTLGELSDAVLNLFVDENELLYQEVEGVVAAGAAEAEMVGVQRKSEGEGEDEDQFPSESNSSSSASLARKGNSSTSALKASKWSSSAKILLGGGGGVGVGGGGGSSSTFQGGGEDDEDMEAGLASGFGQGD